MLRLVLTVELLVLVESSKFDRQHCSLFCKHLNKISELDSVAKVNNFNLLKCQANVGNSLLPQKSFV